MYESNSLPYELLNEICALACIDGGKTGRSLSLASRYFSDVVEPFRWKTIAFHNLHEVKSFARYVDKASDRRKRGARHMFISCPALGGDGQGDPSDVLDQPRPVFRSVFEAVAPTLETFVFHDDTHLRFTLFPSAILSVASEVSAGWPRMTEVTLRSRDGHSYLHEETCYLMKVMPELQRLHLFAPNSIHTYARLLDHMQRCIHDQPRHPITHLRFSEVDKRYSQGIVGLVWKALALLKSNTTPWWPKERPEVMAVTWPCHLKHCLIQHVFLEDRAVTEQFIEEISGASRWLKGVLNLLPTGDYGLAEAYRDWVDRASGGPGCWEAGEA